MSLNPTEISELIKERIETFHVRPIEKTEGEIVSCSDGIVRIHGLESVRYGERLEFEHNHFGIALNLERDSVGAVVLGDSSELAEGQKVYCTGEILKVPVGDALLGRVVDALGRPIDELGAIDTEEFSAIEKVAPGVIWRQSVSEPLATGLKAIDAMVPIGQGQRELIIGDRQTGKTAIVVCNRCSFYPQRHK